MHMYMQHSHVTNGEAGYMIQSVTLLPFTHKYTNSRFHKREAMKLERSYQFSLETLS